MKIPSKFFVRTSLFIFRLHLFLLAYFVYCINVLFLFLNFKNISRKLFTLSAFICSISLGLKLKIDKKTRQNLAKKGIHTINHDNPLDILVAQCVFQMPTITNVNEHLNKFYHFLIIH